MMGTPIRKRSLAWMAIFTLAISYAPLLSAERGEQEVVIDFEHVPIRLDPTNDEVINRRESYKEHGVEFRLSRQPQRSKARGKIMFFPHIPSGRKGILNAMANEQEIPVQVRFPHTASAVTIVFWASTGASARLDAFDSKGKSSIAISQRSCQDVKHLRIRYQFLN
jgi:hypothetical protein